MLYTPLTKRAMLLCFDAHAGQMDKCGMPYVNHPLHLAEQMGTEDEVCVALLHDVMEDCDKTPDDLRAIGVSERAIEALTLLTHQNDAPYLEYVRELKSNDLARKVKVADLRHNSELARLDEVSNKDLRRLRKYMEARVLLGDMAYELETPVGPVGVTVNGERYPFSVVDETYAPYVNFEECENDAAHRNASPVTGRPDKTFRLEVETLPLSPGDEVAIAYDFGNRVVEWGSDEGVGYSVYEVQGHVIGIGFADDESDFNGTRCAYRLSSSSGTYEIVDSPIHHRFYPCTHRLGVRIAWRKGTTDGDAAIVAWTAGL